MSNEEATFLGKEVFYSMKKFEEKAIKFEELLKDFSKNLVANNSDILVSSFGFYKNESFKTLSNSWEKNNEGYSDIVAFFDKGVNYLNEEKALSLTRYIFDNNIQCLKIQSKDDSTTKLPQKNAKNFKSLHIPLDSNSTISKCIDSSSNFNLKINSLSINEDILGDFYILDEEKESFKKIIKVYKQYLSCKKNDVVYFLNPQHQINEQKIALILICSKELSSQDLYKIMIFFRAIINEELYDKIQETALRAAISQVMVRCMSHNLGSHVMNKLISPEYLENFCSYGNCLESYKPFENIDESKEHLLFHQLAIYNNYVKCRMDYLSDISFGTPLMQTSKNVHGDLFKKLDRVRLLLENISGLSNFKYSLNFQNGDKPITEANDFPLAVPNDVLGDQAFYNIIENVIRNTAKHGQNKKDKTIFTIRFEDLMDSDTKSLNDKVKNEAQTLKCVKIFDNVDLSTMQVREIEAGGDKTSFIDWLVYQQNKILNEDILSENSQLRTSSLGLIEMEASASYLRKLDSSVINEGDFKVDQNAEFHNSKGILNILKAIKVDEKYLGYRFFMLKPQEVLIVCEETITSGTKKDLRNQGIWIETKKEFRTQLENNGVYNHQFILHSDLDEDKIDLLDGTEIKKVSLLEHYKTSMSLRVIKFEVNDLKILLSKTAKQIEEKCWEVWEEKLESYYSFENSDFTFPTLKDKTATITNHLERGENTTIEQRWEQLKTNAYFVEPSSSKAQNSLPDFIGRLDVYIYELKNSLINKVKIIESIFTKIVVIDERVQEAYETSPLGIIQREVYQYMRIYGPNRNNMNLSEATFGKSLIDDIKAYVEERIGDCDFIIIHYSILERMFHSATDRILAMNEYLIEISKKCNVVITSGRGTPDKLPKEVRFLNLSSVILAFNEVRGKYLINYLLNSSRRTNRL